MSGAALRAVTGGVVAAPTMALAVFAARQRGEDLPAGVRDALGNLFLDFLRVASIGTELPWSGWARDYIAALRHRDGGLRSRRRGVSQHDLCR
jgi:hypothetical protein